MNQEVLDQLVEELKETLGDRLVSVVLYGSAVTGDFQEKLSDLNVLAVLHQVGLSELEDSFAAIDWWMKKKQPAPVLLSREEIQNAHDAFAIEFLDIRAAYRILHGEDVIEGIEVDSAHHRHQVEHELRSRLLRLRERYLALQKDRKEITRLMVDSIPTFATLVRHALILSAGDSPVKKRDIFAEAAARFSVSAAPFETLLDIRQDNRRLKDPEIRPLFEDYLQQITRIAESVDRL